MTEMTLHIQDEYDSRAPLEYKWGTLTEDQRGQVVALFENMEDWEIINMFRNYGPAFEYLTFQEWVEYIGLSLEEEGFT